MYMSKMKCFVGRHMHSVKCHDIQACQSKENLSMNSRKGRPKQKCALSILIEWENVTLDSVF